MTEEGAAIREAFTGHDAFALEETDGAGSTATVTTTAFETTVAVEPADGVGVAVTLTVEMPTLRAAVRGEEVGSALLEGWLDALERRLADAPKSTRDRIDLDGFDVESDGDRVVVTYAYTSGDAARAIGVAKTFAEYVEGTYVQGVVPGFEYDPPVSDLLEAAGGSGDGPGGTPL